MKKLLRLALVLVAAFTMQINTSSAQTNLTEAVDFTATDTDGNTWNLFDELADGKYVLIDFFFTTWSTCPASIPHLNTTFEYFGCGDFDVTLLSIAIGDTDAAVIAYDELYGVLYPSISGVEGGGTTICNAYGIAAYPTHIIIAPDHTIIEQDIWPISSPSDFIDPLEAAGCEANECGSSTLTADFAADQTEICQTDEVIFTDNSIGGATSWEWTFDGGDPATSDEQNPTVTYNTDGIYDVTLTVTNDLGEESTLLQEDLITVSALSALFEVNETDVCNEVQVQFTDLSTCNAESWSWTFEGGAPETSDEQNPMVTYAVGGTFDVTLTVTNANGDSELIQDNYMTVHNCTAVDYLYSQEMSIAPNPGNGELQLVLPGTINYDVFIYDLTGHLLYKSSIAAGENQLDISHLESGVYLINADNGIVQYKERVIIK